MHTDLNYNDDDKSTRQMSIERIKTTSNQTNLFEICYCYFRYFVSFATSYYLFYILGKIILATIHFLIISHLLSVGNVKSHGKLCSQNKMCNWWWDEIITWQSPDHDKGWLPDALKGSKSCLIFLIFDLFWFFNLLI